MSSYLSTVGAGFGLQDKTVQQLDKKQFLGDSYDSQGNVTNSPLLELANNIAGKAGTAQGRSDMAFGGGGGVPTPTKMSSDGTITNLWANGLQTRGPGQAGFQKPGDVLTSYGPSHSGFTTPTTNPHATQTSAPGPVIIDKVTPKGGPILYSTGGTPSGGSPTSGGGPVLSSTGVVQPPPAGGGPVLSSGYVKPDGSVVPGTIMPGQPGYAGPGM